MPGGAPTKSGTKDFSATVLAGFPDLRFEVEDVLPSGNKVVCRVNLSGTHTGDSMGMPATGKSANA